jgi:hypothetical protein
MLQGKTDLIQRVALKIRDNHPALEGKTIEASYGPNDINSVVESVVVHHNFNDSVTIRLPALSPDLSYAIAFSERSYIRQLSSGAAVDVRYEISYPNQVRVGGTTKSRPTRGRR